MSTLDWRVLSSRTFTGTVRGVSGLKQLDSVEVR